MYPRRGCITQSPNQQQQDPYGMTKQDNLYPITEGQLSITNCAPATAYEFMEEFIPICFLEGNAFIGAASCLLSFPQATISKSLRGLVLPGPHHRLVIDQIVCAVLFYHPL